MDLLLKLHLLLLLPEDIKFNKVLFLGYHRVVKIDWKAILSFHQGQVQDSSISYLYIFYLLGVETGCSLKT